MGSVDGARRPSVKLVVLWGHPADPATFESDYQERHLALARQIPGVALTTWLGTRVYAR